MNKQKIIIIALASALFILSQYVLYEKLTESQQQEIVNVYQNGYNKGLTDAVTTIYRQTENCHNINIILGNLTKNIIDSSCIKNSTKMTIP